MKKFVLLIIMVSMAIVSEAKNPLNWGVEAGWNISYPIDSSRAEHGFRVGVFGEIGLSKHFFLDASLRFSLKPWETVEITKAGQSWDQDLLTSRTSQKGNPFVLELPVHAGFRFNLNSNLAMNLAVGPYIATGLFGKYKDKIVYEDKKGNITVTKESNNIYCGDESIMNRFEVGADARIGLEIKQHYLISLGYQFQFNNPEKAKAPLGRSQVFNIGLGYRF